MVTRCPDAATYILGLVGANVDGVASTYQYNGLGQRMAQTVDGVTTEYVMDVADGLPEVIVATMGGASTYYVQIRGQILAQHDSGMWSYVAPDALGSARQLVDPSGQVTLARSYDPFGNLFKAAGTGVSGFGYTGEQEDGSTGLLFLRARYYVRGWDGFSARIGGLEIPDDHCRSIVGATLRAIPVIWLTPVDSNLGTRQTLGKTTSIPATAVGLIGATPCQA